MAPVEVGQYRVEAWIPKVGPVAVRALEDQAIDAEDVEGVGQLVERAVHVGQRQAGEVPEAARRVGHHPGSVVVACHGQSTSPAVVSEVNPGGRYRQHGPLDADPVHDAQGELRTPLGEGATRHLGHRGVAQLLEERRGQKMMVQVDPTARHDAASVVSSWTPDQKARLSSA